MNRKQRHPMLIQKIKLFATSLIVALAVITPFDVALGQAPPIIPPNIVSTNAKPMMMITASKEHSLFGPIYNDFEDIDGDGVIDTDFKPTFKYYGYFDSRKCYSYSTTNNRFDPAEATTGTNYACPDDDAKRWWSGNFLNWSTMTRIDVIRKMLYGGRRETDTTALTVLERANISQDGHSFVKYYNGTDVRSYTPYKVSELTKTTGINATNTFSVAAGGATGYSGLTICNQSTLDTSGGIPVMRLVKGNYRLWATIGKTVCRWGDGSTGTSTDWTSEFRFNPKLSRYYGKNKTIYGGGNYLHELQFPSIATDGAKQPGLDTGSGAFTNAELQVRVAACVTGRIGDERCTNYGSATLAKPTGLLQEFGMPSSGGTTAKAEFGLITGGYDLNLDAGVLRKNMGDLADEINLSTGQFCHSTSVSCPTGTAPLNDGRTTGPGAIASLDRLVLFGRVGGTYGGSENTTPSNITNGTTPAWGNPMGEMIVQALRYYAQSTSTNPASVTNDNTLSLPVVGNGSWPAWRDPLSNSNTLRKARYGDAVCRPLNILAISSSSLSFDGNQAPTDFATLPNRVTRSLADFTNIVGTLEGLSGSVKSVGSVTGGFGTSCTAKTINLFSDVSGVCPDAPALGGSYLSSGAALYANTTRVRNFGGGANELPGTQPTDLPNSALKVKTYAASLAGGAARVEVRIPGTNKFVYITPEAIWGRNPANPVTAGLLTFNSISSSSTHGAFVVTWNDQYFGGDYDMDLVGYLRYDIVTDSSSVSGYYIDVTTDIIGVNAGAAGAHGFSIIGTKSRTGSIPNIPSLTLKDGRYLTHAHFADTRARRGSAKIYDGTTVGEFLCKTDAYRLANPSPCAVDNSVFGGADNDDDRIARVADDIPTTLRFEMLGVENVLLNDPLWYAAKYGSFDSGTGTFTATSVITTAKWDSKRADGQACGGTTGLSCSDGIPDGYFLARRPELLERQLRDQLDQIVAASNAAPAVSASQLENGSYKYEAQFDATLKTGSVLARQIGSNGRFNTDPSWNAGELLRQLPIASRQIITSDSDKVGLSFLWSSMNATYTTSLKGTASASFDARGMALVDYMRGSISDENPNGQKFQARSATNLLGTIVNSTPWVQDTPGGFYNDSMFPANTPSFRGYVVGNIGREKVLWVGANDGMLHAFKAETGAPVISYVPWPLVSNLQNLAAQSDGVTVAGMDGSPYTGEVLRTVPSTGSSTWSTYLFSSLGRGGRGIFALDVTNPADLVQSNAANIFKWQFTSSDDPDLGFIVSDPSINKTSGQASAIVRLNNGKSAILVHNGINSTGGKAKLLILTVDGPSTTKVWTTGTHYYSLPTNATDTGNGLMGANWVDIDGNGTVDWVYGTDLKGNVWKFDLTSSDPANWGSAFKTGTVNNPFYTATGAGSATVSITTSPAFGYPDRGGIMVVFGTGKAIAGSGDFPNTSVTNRMFGIYDRTGTTTTFATPVGTSNLVQHSSSFFASGTTTGTVTAAVNLATKDGWFFNFPFSSEMLLSSPDARSQFVGFTTVRAADTATTQCFYKPPARLYAIDPNTGLMGIANLGSYFDSSTGQTIYTFSVDIGDQKVTFSNNRTSAFARSGPVTTAVGTGTDDKNIFGASSGYRIQWREIPGLSTWGK